MIGSSEAIATNTPILEIDAVRETLPPATWASVVDELVILALFGIVLALVGIYLLRRALRLARIVGTLGTA